MPLGSDNPFPSILATEGTTPASPASGKQRLFVRSSDHVLCLVNSAGTVTAVGSGGSAGHIATATARRTSGNITLNSTSEASVDTGLDLTLAAATGDIITVSINGLHGSESVVVNLDVATIVSAAPVNYFGVGLSGSNQGLLGWSKQNAGAFAPIVGSATYVVQAGDISGGNVVLRLRYKTGASVNSTLYAATATAFQWAATVWRPA